MLLIMMMIKLICIYPLSLSLIGWRYRVCIVLLLLIASILLSSVSSSSCSKKLLRCRGGAKTSSQSNGNGVSELLSIDLSGRYETLVSSGYDGCDVYHDNLEPLIERNGDWQQRNGFSNILMRPDIYVGGTYDLSKGLSSALRRISSTFIWKLQGLKTVGSRIRISADKGLYRNNDYVSSIGISGGSINKAGSVLNSSLELRYSTKCPKIEVDACTHIWKRLKLIAKSTLLIDSDVPHFYFHSKIPELEDNSDSWIPNFRLSSNGQVLGKSQLGLRSFHRSWPAGIHISVRKRLSDWGTWIDSDWRSDPGIISIQLRSSNQDGDVFQSLSIDSDLNENIFTNARASISLESVKKV